ncbi:MAG: hypothetical protein ACKVOW_16355 [Chitinophagaceae bacterium]
MYVNDTIAFECYLRKGLFGTKLEILFQDMERPIEIVRTDGVFYLLVDKYTFHFEAKWFGKSRYIFYKDFERIGENPSWGFFSSQDYPQLYSLNFYDENEYIYYFILFFAVLLEVSMG